VPRQRSVPSDLVTLTERAAAHSRRLLADEQEPAGTTLRLEVDGRGCAGFRYALAFDGPPGAGDALFESHGIRLVVDRRSLPHVAGADVDFEDGAAGGFSILNPNEAGPCGCGASFFAPDPATPAPPPTAPGCGCGD
jgi:iron-sulfur cluster assembly accessory protein